MTEIAGKNGVRGSRSGIEGGDLAVGGWPQDQHDMMEASDTLFSQYERTLDIALLDEAIDLAKNATAAKTPFRPAKAALFSKLHKMLERKFEHTQDISNEDMAWIWLIEEMGKPSGGPMAYATVCNSLLNLRRRFEGAPSSSTMPGENSFISYQLLGKVADLEEAIVQMEKAVEKCLPGPARAGMLRNWAIMLVARFERLGDLKDLELAAGIYEETLRRTVVGDPSHIAALVNLGIIFVIRFDRVGALGDLEKAMEYTKDALATTLHGHPHRAAIHGTLGNVFSLRFERVGDFRDLQNAIKHSEEALAATPGGHPARGITHRGLGNMFSTRFSWIGDLDDLQKAITHGEAALATTPQDHPGRASGLHTLGGMFSTRFERIGDLRDLEKAIQLGEEALAATPQDHPDRASRHNRLGNMFCKKFERMGDLRDLQKAIQHGEEALAATPIDYLAPVIHHNNLGNMFSRRFDRIGDLGDLEQAIKHGENALAATPPAHPHRASLNNNLAAFFSSRFKRVGDLSDLENSINHGEEALASIPQDHPDRARLRSNLGATFAMRFERMGEIDDHQKAITHGEEALASTPPDHPDRAVMHGTMGEMFSIKFHRTRDLCDLQQAIKHNQEALVSTPRYSSDRLAFCFNLASNLQARYTSLHSAEDLNECLRLYHEVRQCRISPPRDRIRAAHGAACLLLLVGGCGESISILEDAISLMPNVHLRLLKRDDQQHMLSELSGLASKAASITLLAGREAYRSLKLLELGRGVILGFTIDSRSEVSQLRTDHPPEFDQFHRLRVEIDSPAETAPPQRRNRDASRRWEAVNEMEVILTRIRTLPGYGGFLLPPPPEDLIEIATYGPIVVFNCTSYRSDAIIVTTSGITSLELPELSYEKTSYWMAQLAGFGGGNWVKRGRDNRKMKDLLIWLWDAAVRPVFDHLERSGDTVSESVHVTPLKRIWWIGVGQLSMAPFHAAGDHSEGSTRNTLSRAISTYIPTIKALSYARQAQLQLFNDYKYNASFSTDRSKKAKIVNKRNPRLLLVPMEKTPGALGLPGVDKEVQYIRDSTVKNSIETTVLSSPTPAEVLQQVRHHDIVHFACHGVSDINPSDSHLVLFTPDGNDADKLMARDISNMITRNGQLAYLSACSSARNPSANLADEVIHLASAFQLAGFSHTLANLWETDDLASSEVARDFYNFLFQYNGDGNEHYRVSASFHKAVKKARDKRPNNFLAWAPFVHMGA